MEPIPETRRAVETMGDDGRELLDQLVARADEARRAVPSCVGATLATMHDGLAFTVVATSNLLAEMDGIQYLFGGPCVSAAESGGVVNHRNDDPLDEGVWQEFAAACSDAQIASTLTMPILIDGVVAGTVNLYAATPHAFDGHADDMAALFDAWAAGAVHNADLDFTTLDAARRTHRRVEEQATVDRGIGIVMEALGIGAEEAAMTLADAAHRAGISEVDLARRLIQVAQLDD